MSRTALLITNSAPFPVGNGGQWLASTLVRYYARMGFALDLASLVAREGYDEANEDEASRRLFERRRLVRCPMYLATARMRHVFWAVQSLLERRAFMSVKLNRPAFFRAIRELVQTRKYDLVQIGLPLQPQLLRLLPRPHIYVQENVDTITYEMLSKGAPDRLRRWFYHLQSRWMTALERAMMADADLAWFMGDEDISRLRTIGIRPNCARVVDIEIEDRFLPDSCPPVIISLGMLSARKRHEGTLWFAKQVFPRILAQCPEAVWHIVGLHPGADICALQDGKRILVHGFVDDLGPLLSQARVCVVPLFTGTGRQMKIDSMASFGVPCVATTIGACNSSLRSGEEILIADDPVVFAEHVTRVLADNETYMRLRRGLRAAIIRSRSAFDRFAEATERCLLGT